MHTEMKRCEKKKLFWSNDTSEFAAEKLSSLLGLNMKVASLFVYSVAILILRSRDEVTVEV